MWFMVTGCIGTGNIGDMNHLTESAFVETNDNVSTYIEHPGLSPPPGYLSVLHAQLHI